MEISDYLRKHNIIFYKKRPANRWTLITEMVKWGVKHNDIPRSNAEQITNGLIEREKSMSTGIGNGVAIPHVTTDVVQECLIMLAVLKEGIEFDSIDGKPVNIVIMLLVPKAKLSQHVKTLAKIAKLMKNEEVRNRILSSTTPDSVYQTVREYEIKMK